MAKKDNKDIKKEKKIIEKAPEIVEAEEEAKGVVSIDFDEEKPPIQTIKEAEKPRHRPKESQIPTIKLPKNPNLQKIDITDPVTHIEIHDLNNAKIVANPVSLEDLEKELQDKLKLLEILKREDEQKKKEEQIRKQEEEQRKQEEERKKIEQEIIIKEEQEIETIKKGKYDILLMPYDEKFLKFCPKCNKKVKRGKVKQNGLVLTQSFECSDLYCNFHKDIVLHI